jgi:hypothetical protein
MRFYTKAHQGQHALGNAVCQPASPRQNDFASSPLKAGVGTRRVRSHTGRYRVLRGRGEGAGASSCAPAPAPPGRGEDQPRTAQ